ncbi:hypothetical protein [Nocardioides sp. AX2bis]|uniref:hypothetical protein n=1 Tax=Nocardioides sp. AX2bis TaxID=2653157 RepID=UPI0012F0BF16|nr:hypothetical protein [Nocardioides sp. AX2bis]VXB81069.1 hypothetical protein NOCARDAX2BIS_360023 [Nocardioides sp. AX2bis]
MRGLIDVKADVVSSVHSNAVGSLHKGLGDGGGELFRQVTDDEPGIDDGRVGGKALGGGLARPLPTGVSGPTGKGISEGVDAVVP